jgi:hypothetical protein
MTKSPTAQPNQSSTPRHWKVHVEALKQSGLSRAEYCRQHKLSYHTLTYWQRKLSTSKPTSKETTLVPASFNPIISRYSDQPERSALKIILSDKIAVEIGDNFSSATLTRLLATLECR